MKLAVRALVLGICALGASAAVTTSHAKASTMVSRQSSSAALPIPSCGPDSCTNALPIPSCGPDSCNQ